MAFRKRKPAAELDVAAPEPGSMEDLQAAMEAVAVANPNLSNKTGPNPTCQVEGDTREGQSLVAITGKMQGHTTKLQFNVWVCDQHYAELTW